MQRHFLFVCLVLVLAVKAEDPPKIGHCPHGLDIADAKPCTSNSDCPHLQLCCNTNDGQQVCSEPRETKQGQCPEPELINPGLSNCSLDIQCEGYRKCCPDGPHSYTCSDPVFKSKKQKKSSSFGRSLFKRETPDKDCFNPKYGNCPKLQFINPTRQCNTDGDCPGNKKCCQIGSDPIKRCSDPENSRIGSCPASGGIVDNNNKCYLDSNCKEGNKCCKGPDCDYYCTPPDGNTQDKTCFSLTNKPDAMCPLSVSTAAERCDLTKPNPHDACSGNRICCLNFISNTTHCADPFTNRPGRCPKPWQMATQESKPCYSDSTCTEDPRMKCCPFDGCTYFCNKPV